MLYTSEVIKKGFGKKNNDSFTYWSKSQYRIERIYLNEWNLNRDRIDR